MDPRSAATADDLRRQWDLAINVVRALERPRSEKAKAELMTVLGVVESGDRIPPAVAYRMFEEATQ